MRYLLFLVLFFFMPLANASMGDGNNAIKIDYLANHPELAPQLAKWTFDKWRSYNPDMNQAEELAKIKSRMHTTEIPMTLVALENGRVIGMANLKREAEVPGLPADKVWVGSFFVLPNKTQAAPILLQALCEQALRLHVAELWVWESSWKDAAFYRKQGWKFVEKRRFKNHYVTVLKWEAATHSF